jgi:hypothetical protein
MYGDIPNTVNRIDVPSHIDTKLNMHFLLNSFLP